MADTLKVTIVQINIIWENKQKNLNNIQTIIENLSKKTDLIILPEMFTTGFSMKPSKFAENMNDGITISWMQSMAKNLKAAISGSIIIEDPPKVL